MSTDPRNRIPIDLLIGGICKRPAMYVGCGSDMYHAATAFLCGWFAGLAEGLPEDADVAAWSDFNDWLHDRLRCPKSIVVLARLGDGCPDDIAALEKLAALWSEYRGQRQE
jgi:hypothetical protein